MVDDRREVSIMQYLGLDYGQAIKSTTAFIDEINKLDESLKKIETWTKNKSKIKGFELDGGDAEKLVRETKKAVDNFSELKLYATDSKLSMVDLANTTQRLHGIDAKRLKENREILKSLKEELSTKNAISDESIAQFNAIKKIADIEREIAKTEINDNKRINYTEQLNAEQQKLLLKQQQKLASLEALTVEQNVDAKLIDVINNNKRVLDGISERVKLGQNLTDADEKSLKYAELEIDLVQKRIALEKSNDRVSQLKEEKKYTDEISVSKQIERTATLQQKAERKNLNKDLLAQIKNEREILALIQKQLGANGQLTAEQRKQVESSKRKIDLLQSQVNADTQDVIRNSTNFSEELKRRIGWFVSGQLWYGFVEGAKNSVKVLKDVEMGMKEIGRVVKDVNYDNVKFRNDLMELGKEFGFTFNDMQPIALRWAQSGYDASETLELTKNSLLALNVAELDAQQSTEGLIAIMQQWNLEAKDSELVIDKINKTADNFAITSQDLVDGLMKSSSAAKNMNVTFDELLGLLTATKEASGATGKEVGNALKSIMAYVQRKDSIKTLAESGINVFADKEQTTFRSVLDIFKDISSKWGTLSKEIQDGFVKSADEAGLFNEELAVAMDMTKEFSDIQKRDISQASAGVFRRNYFISLIENLTQAEKVMKNLENVAGYSARENAQTMDTAIKKSEQLKNAFEKLIITLGDSGVMDALKTLTDTAKSFVEVLNGIPTPIVKAVTSFGIMQASIKGTGIVFTELKNAFAKTGLPKLFGVATANVNHLSKVVKHARENNITWKESFNELPRTISGTQKTTESLGKSVDQLKVATKGATAETVGFKMGLSSWISVGLTAVSVIYSVIKGIQAQREEEKRAVIERRKQLKEEEESYASLNEKYKEFVELEKKASSTKATQEDRKALKDLQYELAESFDDVTVAIDSEGRKYVKNSEILKEYIELKKEELEINAERVASDYDKNLKDDISQMEENIKKIAEQEKLIKQNKKDLDDYMNGRMSYIEKHNFEKSGFGFNQGDIDRMNADISKMKEQNLEIKKSFIDRRNIQLKYFEQALKDGDKFNVKISEQTEDRIKKLIASGEYDKLGVSQFKTQMSTIVNEVEKSVEEINKHFERVGRAKIGTHPSMDFLNGWGDKAKEFGKVIEKLAGKYEILKKEVLEANRNMNESLKSFDEANNIYRDNEGRILALSSSQLELSLEVQRLGNQYKELERIQQELNNTGVLTAEQLEILKRIFPDLAEKTGMETNAIIQLVNTAVVGFDKYVMANMNLTQIAYEGSAKRVAMIQKELQAWLGLVNGIGAVNQQLNSNVRAVDVSGEGDIALNPKFNRKTTKRAKDLVNEADNIYRTASNRIEEAIKDIGKLDKSIGGLGKSVGGVGKSMGGSAKATKEQNKALDEALKKLEQRKKLEEETFTTAKRDLEELRQIKKKYARTNDELMDMDVRIMEQERRYFQLRLQFSKDWIDEQKRLRIMNTQDEIDAWERIKNNQADSIDAMKEAEIKLYELRNQLRDEQIAKEERYISLRRNIGLSNTQDEINAYETMYKQFEPRNQEEQFSRIENLYKLYHTRVDELFKDIDNAHNNSINEIERKLKDSPLNSQLKDLENQRRELVKLQQEADKLKDLTEVGRRLRELRNEAKELGMDTRGLFAELPKEYLKYLDGELTGLELLENAHKSRLKYLEEEAKYKSELKQKEIDDIERQIKAIEDLEKAENKQDRVNKLKEELAYWRVRTSEEARKKVKELEEQLNKLEKDDKRETEKDKLKSTADRLKDEQKQLDDAFNKRKKQLEDEYNVERRIKEEIGKLNRTEKADKIRYQIEMLDARKQSLEEEKRMIEERAREEIEFRRNQYEQLKNGFNEHATQIVALAGTLSKDAYNEWMQNYVIPLQNAVSKGNYGEANDIQRRGNDWLRNQDNKNREYFTRPNIENRNNNREIYSLVERIVQLKYDWDRYRKNGNEEAAHRANLEAIELRKRLAKFNPALAQQLANSNYYQAMQILTRLPKMHSGGKTLSYGAVYMKPGELVFPPNLSKKLETLIGVLDNKKFPSNITNNDTKSSTININSLLSTDRIDFRDRNERDDVVKQLMKNLRSIANK